MINLNVNSLGQSFHCSRAIRFAIAVLVKCDALSLATDMQRATHKAVPKCTASSWVVACLAGFDSASTLTDDAVFRQAMSDTLSGPVNATELVTTGGGNGSSSDDSGGSTVTLQSSAAGGRRLQEAGSRSQRHSARRLSAATPVAQVQSLFPTCSCSTALDVAMLVMAG